MSRHERDGTSEAKNKLDSTTQNSIGNAIQSASLSTTMEAAVHNKMKENGMLPEMGGSMNVMMRQERLNGPEKEMVKEDHTTWDELEEVEESEQGAAGGEDAELKMLQARRRRQMQKEHEQHQSNLAKGHGQYLQIDETEFIKVMTNSHHVVCHFYHHDFDRCKIIDMHLGRLCRKYTKCKFVSVDAERCPFFSQKLQIQTLPTVVMFEDGVAIDRIMGFEEIGNGTDVFPTSALGFRIGASGVIKYEHDPDDPELNHVIGDKEEILEDDDFDEDTFFE